MNSYSKRIIYVDIMRAFAVIMMIQGHTVDTFLSNEYRTMDSIFYSVWHTMRGFTAPIFMFTAGMIFTYLLKPNHFKLSENPRIIKGIKRSFLLIGIGYLLRYPTYRIFDFSYVSKRQWDIFFAVDALHLIGFGMLVIIFAVVLSKRAHLSFKTILYILITSLLLFSPIFTKIEWINFFPQYISSYFTKSYGSLFPLFPWLAYVLGGALVGDYLYKNDGIYLKKRFSFSLLSIGGILILTSFFFFSLESAVEDEMDYWFSSTGIVLLRIGYVILINGIMAFIVRKAKVIPEIVKETGKKTLLLYVTHIIILYGCAWFPGLYNYYAKTFNPIECIVAVSLMIGLMLSIVQFSEKINIYRKLKLVFNKV